MADRPGASHLIAEVAAAIDAVAPFLPSDNNSLLGALHNRLKTPLRVALVGRVNAGKSTLLNALVGQRVAPTNETECTRVATWFRFGAPARVEVFGIDNTVTTIPLRHRLPDEFGVPPARIAHVIAYIPSGLLREYELIDTPGLGTMDSTSYAATRLALVGAAGSSIERPDGTLFLCDSAPRADEVAFLNEMAATRINTVTLLSRADTFGEGAFSSVDPFEMATKHAQRLEDQLARLSGEVVPVSGLLAETALTGHFTEADARMLGELAEIDDLQLASILAGQQEAAITPEDVDRLLDLLGVYGILHGRKLARHGAVAVARWMAEKSGVTAVHELIARRFVRRSEVLKARYVLARIADLADTSPYRDQICAVLENTRMHPDLHALRELAALDLMLQWDPTHPLVLELDHLGISATPAEALRLPPTTDTESLRNAAQQACRRCRRERLTAISAAERETWTVLERSYQLLFSP